MVLHEKKVCKAQGSKYVVLKIFTVNLCKGFVLHCYELAKPLEHKF